MKTIRPALGLALLGGALALAACGAEAVGSAATGAAVKQQELENAKRTQQQLQQDVQKAMEIPPERAKQLDP
jgi:ABC-type glycerol-3-phosphate transport system substrate-binding protein